MFARPYMRDQLTNMGRKHITYVLIISTITACLFITDQQIKIMKGNRLETRGDALGDHHCLPTVDSVDGTYFLRHYLSIWEYAALLNVKHSLGDLSSDQSRTARGSRATIACKGTAIVAEMRGLINWRVSIRGDGIAFELWNSGMLWLVASSHMSVCASCV